MINQGGLEGPNPSEGVVKRGLEGPKPSEGNVKRRFQGRKPFEGVVKDAWKAKKSSTGLVLPNYRNLLIWDPFRAISGPGRQNPPTLGVLNPLRGEDLSSPLAPLRLGPPIFGFCF